MADNGNPIAWVWTEHDVRSGHYKVVAARRGPTAAEESRLLRWSMHAHVTECRDAGEIIEAMEIREGSLKLAGAARVRRERR